MKFDDPRLPVSFWNKCEVGPGSCWLWTGFLDRLGYGCVRMLGSVQKAHRMSAIVEFGDIASLDVDHLCRVRRCVNPAHLEPVTHRVNVLRGVAPTAENARKTACKNGHAFSADNTYDRPGGSRVCKQCVRDAGRRYRRSKK
jgi:hypothetical protein